VRQHLQILRNLLDEKGVKQKDIAKRLGLASPSAAGMKLRGERGMTREELRIMCEMAGITIVALAELSDDLHLAEYAESVEAASIVDELLPEDRAQAMLYLRHLRSAKLNKK
jgi:transcriptional regulator with XRE-family HTH domain